MKKINWNAILCTILVAVLFVGIYEFTKPMGIYEKVFPTKEYTLIIDDFTCPCEKACPWNIHVGYDGNVRQFKNNEQMHAFMYDKFCSFKVTDGKTSDEIHNYVIEHFKEQFEQEFNVHVNYVSFRMRYKFEYLTNPKDTVLIY